MINVNRMHLHTQPMYLQTLLARLEQMQKLISTLPESKRWQSEIEVCTNRLIRQDKVVAVFGAFSAGKSSLLNGLLGKSLLAVSPNPTTATITQIRSSEKTNEVAAVVTAKTSDQIWEDVRQTFALLHQTPNTLEDAVQLANQLNISDFPTALRPAVSFLRAVAKGFTIMKDKLGTQWIVGSEEVAKFTAEEFVACYVAHVELLTDAPLLQEGFVFVDTPGVDSIHRRHTDVAFDYMRQADAILFVLYYSHAFSRADKDFLQQLSGVQDVVGTDKLFVVINAVDLAKSEEEQHDVRERVMTELRSAGIRQPRVFEISSQLAFAASQLMIRPEDPQFIKLVRLRLRLLDDTPVPNPSEIYMQSGVDQLIKHMQEFVYAESEALANEVFVRTWQEICTGVSAIEHRLLIASEQDETVKAERLHDYQQLNQALQQETSSVQEGKLSVEERVRAEWEELLFHAGERIRFRFAGLFRESFYPGRFRVGMQPKMQLQEAALECMHHLERQIEIELRTFALRVAAQLKTACQEFGLRIQEKCSSHHMDHVDVNHLVGTLSSELSELDFTNVGYHVELSTRSIEKGFRYFSSPRQFFEEGGQQEMLIAVQEETLHLVIEHLQNQGHHMVEMAIENLRINALHQITKVQQEISERIQDLQQTPSAHDLQLWHHIHEELMKV